MVFEGMNVSSNKLTILKSRNGKEMIEDSDTNVSTIDSSVRRI